MIINTIAFFLCYLDKQKAIKSKRRIPERILLGISFIGGTFSFWIAMYLFHHKTKHLKFIILAPIFTIMWIIIILYYYKIIVI